MTHKFAAKLPNEECYIFRFYPPSRAHVVEYEPDLLRSCFQAGVGTPEVVIDSRTGPPASLNYVLYRMIQGTPLVNRLSSLSPEALKGIARDIVVRLEVLARIPVLGYGDLMTADRARFHSLGEFCALSFRQGLEAAAQTRLWPRETVETVRAIAGISTQMPENRVALTWGDISAENILVGSNNEIAGLVDFEGVIAANPLLNLGYAYARYYRSGFFDALAQAWPEPLDDQWRWIYFYCVLRAVRLAPFAAEPLPTGHPRTAIGDLLPGFQPATKALSPKN
jgi:aminoglycoside phosphotransferase (APT) family kinase protein